MEMNGVWRCENCGEVVEPVDGRARWAGDRWQHACGDPQAGHYDCRFFGEADAVVCKACGEALVSEPRLDWCVACDRKVCVGCIDHIDDESGMRFCVDCAAKEQPVDREADTTAIDAGIEDEEPVRVDFYRGAVRLLQTCGEDDLSIVEFHCEQSDEVIAAIRKHAQTPDPRDAEIARLRRELEIAATRFASYANYCDEYHWTATGDEFRRFAGEASAALSPAPSEAP